jgi:hypothetical protein
MGEFSFFKITSLLGNSIWNSGGTWLPEMSTQSLVVTRQFRVLIGPAEYQDIAAQIVTDPPPCFAVGTSHSVLWASLGFLQTSTRTDVRNILKEDLSDRLFIHIPCIIDYAETNQINAPKLYTSLFTYTMAPTCFDKIMPSSGGDYFSFRSHFSVNMVLDKS